MAEVWKSQSVETLSHWINTIIEEAIEKLNDRESDFVFDVSEALGNGITLTERQQKWLEIIYVKYTK